MTEIENLKRIIEEKDLQIDHLKREASEIKEDNLYKAELLRSLFLEI